MKTVSVYVLRNDLGDSTANGITSKVNSVWLFSAETSNEEVREFYGKKNESPENALRVVKREYYCNYAEPVFKKSSSEGTYMAGGNFVETCHSVYKEISGTPYPLPVHDRFEDWVTYEGLSR